MAIANLDKLKNLLNELFLVDQADLDFGIYRVMGAKRDEIQRFLANDLLPQVRQSLSSLEQAGQADMQAELDKTIAGAQAAGFDPEQSPKVKELREKLAQGGNPAAMEDDVFSHLYAFFRRYYKDGDFLSLRRYKKDVYALPYEGEEVKLHWANSDQYYIKSSEYFRDYTWKLNDGRRVHFKLAEADTELNNNKAENGKERRFVLVGDMPMVEQESELLIRFEYRVEGEKQAKLNEQATTRILQAPGFDHWQAGMKELPANGKSNGPLLNKHLRDYTARNSFDYFIHKDLSGFLRRELDFYIKNEVMRLDDIEEDTAPRVEQYLTKIRAIRKIAHKLIDMLAQVENFQKKLWLKKKFVVETNYCVTLDRVPEALYAEIAANDAQHAEWVRLFAIDEIRESVLHQGFSTPLTIDFLNSNPSLVLDTQFFSGSFKGRLLSAFDDIDSQLDGLLVSSENFQAVSLLQNRYSSQIRCIYLDPPYNTGIDGFLYKDNYAHSTWASMFADRAKLGFDLLQADGALFVSMDESEEELCRSVLTALTGRENSLGVVIWKKRSGPPNDRTMASVHENIFVYQKPGGEAILSLLPRTDESKARYTNPDQDPRGPWVPGDLSANAKGGRFVASLYYEIVNPVTGQRHLPPEGACWRFNKEKVDRLINEGQIYFGADGRGRPKLKRYLNDVREGITIPSIWDDLGTNTTARAEISALFGQNNAFDTVKPVSLISRIAFISATANSTVADYFAGSGTTGHAVINLNREDGGNRKYLLVEMGEYFDAVTKPRILKVVYSKDWRDGKPVSREGSSHMLKYIRLESYEDALNNLVLHQAKEQLELLAEESELREDYMLRYMLHVESRGSQSLLNIEHFARPFDYTLQIATGSAGETQSQAVDLVETFNYLLGLRVKQIDSFPNIRVVSGHTAEGEKVLIIWRNTTLVDNATLERFVEKQGYNVRDSEFDLIYVNGSNNLENRKQGDETWKVRLIEEAFHRLMFDVKDV